MVELQPSKLIVAGSSPVSRSIFLPDFTGKTIYQNLFPVNLFRIEGHQFHQTGFLNSNSRCSSGVERFLGKEEVTGSNPVIGSKHKFEMS